jgi:cytosine/adenosine deaminase-related metal-dependent hydrolase
MRRAGVPVGLGVDGSASNDSGNLVAEARQAMLLQRVTEGAEAFSARDALRLATRGGAEVLGRGGDCGQIAPGFRADLAIWDMTGVEAAGNWDPAALLLAGPTRVRDLIVNGRVVLSSWRLVDHLAGGNPRHHAAQLLADFLDLVGVVVAARALEEGLAHGVFLHEVAHELAGLDVVRIAFIRALVSS